MPTTPPSQSPAEAGTPLTPAPTGPLGGRVRVFAWRGHRVAYEIRGAGPRVVLLHAIHPAAHPYDWRRNAGPLAERFEVVALDLLGFGRSDRPPLRYTARLYVDLVKALVADVFWGPALLVGSGLSGAYAIQAAAEAPDAVKGLVLSGPTGATRRVTRQSLSGRAIEMLLRSPRVGEALYASLVSRPSLRRVLVREGYADPARATPEVVEAYWRSSHRPGARFAPAALIGGALDLDVRAAFAVLKQPVALVYGERATRVPVAEGEALRRANPRARLEVVPGAAALVHEERPDVFNQIIVAVAAECGLAPREPAGRKGPAAREGR